MNIFKHPLYRSQYDNDKPREECGVFACFSKDRKDVSEIIYFGLQALQHRGQESAGIAVFENNAKEFSIYKKMGLVVDIFDQEQLQLLVGNVGIGHVRYSTVGGSGITNIQPINLNTVSGQCVLAHNGTISNAHSLRELLEDTGTSFVTNSDTEIILNIISNKARFGFPKAIGKTASLLQGSYSLVVAVPDKIMGIKDPYGIRPLCIGILSDTTYVLASESCALDAVGADYVREVEAGEIVSIDGQGIHSYMFSENNIPAPCAFEQIYFARPDSLLSGTNVYNTRLESGKLLYQQVPINADVVMGVPQSGIAAAIGYAEASAIHYEMGIVKNELANRSFINPTQEMRKKEISIKFNIVSHVVKDKCVIVVDDSLVRGNTSRCLIVMLRHAGAKEVHFLSASPSVHYPCYFGIDIAERKELVANSTSVEALAKEIGADSLHFLSLDNLKKAFKNKSHCMGCFTGSYPTYAPRERC